MQHDTLSAAVRFLRRPEMTGWPRQAALAYRLHGRRAARGILPLRPVPGPAPLIAPRTTRPIAMLDEFRVVAALAGLCERPQPLRVVPPQGPAVPPF